MTAQRTAENTTQPSARADSLARAGEHAAAKLAYEELVRVTPDEPAYWRGLGMAAYRATDFIRAAEAFARQAELTGNPVAMFSVGAMLARLDRRDTAFAWLSRAVSSGFRGLHSMRTDGDLASLRGDPRFPPLLATVERNFTPCAFRPEARRFDFWLGEWEVRDVSGQVAGQSRVELVSGQCALYENWTDAGGGTGKSLTAFNAALNRWQQFWVGQGGGVTEFRESHWDGPSLVLSTEPRDGGRRQRMTFTPVSVDVVRQRGEGSRDGGTTWTVLYDYSYHRVRH